LIAEIAALSPGSQPMTTRTTETMVTFERPFTLGRGGELLPAGTYRVELDEELLEDLSFIAYRRTVAVLHLHPRPDQPGVARLLTIEPNALDEALRRDRAAAGRAAPVRS
jgi:hypothetical protein